ncbi:hypothetical protein SAMD00019534_040480 [Acytostelium subglobosum LB1]|uniref:hypothetical protein n=1 Tax=Acytostelium subglobosum LB1 TaxID=1410327 RepID=UPI000644BA3D|nr:hypothetical protein SAMD00019534_040480 [Acytostelium subglobosum LB1]GAM20873.1 hypothetical protein SAMD00019534_040480 [Acytostelium subglobosum LB1]|eukprot:XP_012756007.1 hypothetical protein SAMD00019534_040480 [Acytostelium subglobosum LB1]
MTTQSDKDTFVETTTMTPTSDENTTTTTTTRYQVDRSIAIQRVNDILHPQFDSFGQYLLKGVRFGFLTGIPMGLIIHRFIKTPDNILLSTLKSTINMTFIGTSYMATSYVLDSHLLIPGISNALASGAVSCGLASSVFGGLRQFPVGAAAGGIIAGVGHLVHRTVIAPRPKAGEIGSQAANAKELTQLVKQYNIQLSPIDTHIYRRLLEDESLHKDDLTAIEYLKQLSPLREVSPDERDTLLKMRTHGQINLPGASSPTSLSPTGGNVTPSKEDD